jgi:hypothetical protein
VSKNTALLEDIKAQKGKLKKVPPKKGTEPKPDGMSAAIQNSPAVQDMLAKAKPAPQPSMEKQLAAAMKKRRSAMMGVGGTRRRRRKHKRKTNKRKKKRRTRGKR